MLLETRVLLAGQYCTFVFTKYMQITCVNLWQILPKFQKRLEMSFQIKIRRILFNGVEKNIYYQHKCLHHVHFTFRYNIHFQSTNCSFSACCKLCGSHAGQITLNSTADGKSSTLSCTSQAKARPYGVGGTSDSASSSPQSRRNLESSYVTVIYSSS